MVDVERVIVTGVVAWLLPLEEFVVLLVWLSTLVLGVIWVGSGTTTSVGGVFAIGGGALSSGGGSTVITEGGGEIGPRGAWWWLLR